MMLVPMVLIISACSSKSISYNWDRTKGAAYNAAVDPMTWASLATGLTLDATGYDEDITNHIMKDNPDDFIFSSDDADDLRTLSKAITYTTAVLVPDDDMITKAKRVAVEASALAIGRGYVTLTNSYINKTSPSGTNEDAFGSNHAVAPFISAALTRRNVDQMDIPLWAKYSINTVSYAAASGSAYQRVESGLHSFSDQMYSAAVGNFISIFIHDAFMADDTDLRIDLSGEDPSVTLSFRF